MGSLIEELKRRDAAARAEADRLRTKLAEMTKNPKVQLNIQEIKQPVLDAALIAQGICDQLVRRVAFRRAMKRAIQTVQKAGAQGVRVQCAGRHDLLDACPCAPQRDWIVRERLPEIIDPISFPRLHDVVIDGTYFGTGVFIFDQAQCGHLSLR